MTETGTSVVVRDPKSRRSPGACSADVPPAETIVAAAIRLPVAEKWHLHMWQGERCYPDKLIVTSPPPARHHTLLHTTFDFARSVAFEDQGFITSAGRYVEREEALKIALASGQPMIDHPSRHDRWLFSEDLW